MVRELIKLDKKYKTKSGLDVLIYGINGMPPYTVHGAIKERDGWRMAIWTSVGKYNLHNEGPNDLVEVSEIVFDLSKQWMRRSDGRRPYRLELRNEQGLEHVKYWIDEISCTVWPNGFRHNDGTESPYDLIPYVAREWTRADMPEDCKWIRFSEKRGNPSILITKVCDDAICINDGCWHSWKFLRENCEWAPSHKGPWKRFEVVE